MRWTDDYYLATGGGCRRIPLDADGRIIDGSSIDLRSMTKCSAPGQHPHPPTGKLVGADRTAQRELNAGVVLALSKKRPVAVAQLLADWSEVVVRKG